MIRVKDDPPRFEVGDLVRHRRYGYRGVVVELDIECQAPESWYQSNRTQPLRQQPWYHVLVHGSATATYAAQDNLESDDSDEPVDHPLVELYFEPLVGEQYVRNDQPWVGW